MFRMMEGVKEGKESAQRPEDPQLCHEVNTRWSIFVYPSALAWAFLKLQSSFLGGLPFDGYPQLSCVLAPSGTYKVYDKRVKSATLKVPTIRGDGDFSKFHWK